VKARHREVNIFNMSVLDLLTGALGAFCFLTLALFPSYFKTHVPSASDDQLEKEQERLARQFGKTKLGIPPFSVAQIYTMNDSGQYCGVLKIDDLKAPRGNKSFRQLPFAAGSGAEGYESYAFLFLFDPGLYHMTITAYETSPPCRLAFTQFISQGQQLSTNADLTNAPVPYAFNPEVKPEQLITSILPHR